MPQGWVVVMTHIRSILVIGGVQPGVFSPDVTQTELSYADLTARMLSTILPDLIILPLFGAGFDAIEALGRLHRLGYQGEVLVRTPELPNIKIVERELTALAPTMHVRLTGPFS